MYQGNETNTELQDTDQGSRPGCSQLDQQYHNMESGLIKDQKVVQNQEDGWKEVEKCLFTCPINPSACITSFFIECFADAAKWPWWMVWMMQSELGGGGADTLRNGQIDDDEG